MEHVNLDLLYQEMKAVRKKLEHLEELLVPEEELSKEELMKVDKLRAEALAEHRKGATVRVENL